MSDINEQMFHGNQNIFLTPNIYCWHVIDIRMSEDLNIILYLLKIFI